MNKKEKLVNEINQLSSANEKIEKLSKFILENIKYDYDFLATYKVMRDASRSEFDDIINECNSFSDNAKKEKILNFITTKYDLNEKLRQDYENALENIFDWEFVFSFVHSQALLNISRRKENQECFTIGVCSNIANFVRSVCNECQIKNYIVYGNTPFGHAWNMIEVEGKKLHFDFTYAIYCRDMTCGQRGCPSKYLGIDFNELKELNSQRTIDRIVDNNESATSQTSKN